jgi:hypothetical protein
LFASSVDDPKGEGFGDSFTIDPQSYAMAQFALCHGMTPSGRATILLKKQLYLVEFDPMTR